MKQLLVLFVFLTGLMFVGCSQEGSIVDPVTSTGKSEINWLKMPGTSGLSSEAQLTLNIDVNGATGAYKSFDMQFPGSSVTVSGSYFFPENCLEGEEVITVVFDEATAAAEYYPSPYSFNAPLTANILYSGLDLSGVSVITFVYLPPNSGEVEPVQFDQIVIDREAGTIEVINAKIWHFSKYGFVDGPLD
ncbi:MAG: hypothetical protein R6W90_16475 [Ignavibacteriaceae bacterium]